MPKQPSTAMSGIGTSYSPKTNKPVTEKVENKINILNNYINNYQNDAILEPY